jgi:putative membrane protein
MQQRLTGPTNELAKERNRAAAERTIATWIRNCLGLIGFGFAIDEIFVALNQRSPTAPSTTVLAQVTGILFIVLGIGLLLVAMVQYYVAVKSIERQDYVLMPSRTMNAIAVSAILLFGLLGLVMASLS